MIKPTAIPISFCEIGKIKIGGLSDKVYDKKDGGKFRAPVKYQNFVITTMEKDNTDRFIIDNEIMKKLPPTPRTLDIEFMFDDVNMDLYTSFALYEGRKCLCKGDGEVAIRKYKNGTKTKKVKGQNVNEIIYEERQIVCDPKTCEYVQCDPPKCKPNLILSCRLKIANKIGGVHKFRTCSWNSVQSIQSALIWIYTQTGGKLAGIPLKLKMQKKVTTDNGTIDFVTLEFDGNESDLDNAVMIERDRRKQLGINMKMLQSAAKNSGILEDNDSPEDVENEFYTDAPVKTITDKAKMLNSDTFVTPAIIDDVEPEKAVKTDITSVLPEI